MDLLRPLLDSLMQMVAIAVMMLAAGALRWLAVRLRLQTDEHVRAYLDTALARALDYAGLAAAEELPPGQPAAVLQGTVLNFAADYARRQVPDALRHFNVDEAGLRRMLEARMQEPARFALPFAASRAAG